MENKNSKNSEKSSMIVMLSLLVDILLLSFSAVKEDVRYAALAIIIFSIFYIGNFLLWFFEMYNRDKGVNGTNDIFTLITLFLFSLLFLSLFFFGLSLFLHYYDIDQLFNMYMFVFNQIN